MKEDGQSCASWTNTRGQGGVKDDGWNIPGLRVAGLIVAPSAPLVCVVYIRATSDELARRGQQADRRTVTDRHREMERERGRAQGSLMPCRTTCLDIVGPDEMCSRIGTSGRCLERSARRVATTLLADDLGGRQAVATASAGYCPAL